jgi:tRNA(Ile2)-agmatinylcytidine synthase
LEDSTPTEGSINTYDDCSWRVKQTRLQIHIGLDDTDSQLGGCTTFLASEIVRILVENCTTFLDYPNLVRLNPNIPWKTRGNGAVSLRFEAENPEHVYNSVCSLISKIPGNGANPGAVIFSGSRVFEDIAAFSKQALSEVVSFRKALQLINKYNMRFFSLGNSMGLIGALAAIGGTLEGDHTYELIAYRAKENWGSKRRLKAESVIEMSDKTFPYTYNNYDPETKRVLIAPHGPDPVLFGIRGETPTYVINASHMIKVSEPVDRYLVFRSNQGTGLHLVHPLNLGCLKAYSSGHAIASVSQRPWIGQGGHVYLGIKNEEGKSPCAVYEPAGSLRRLVLDLIPGDVIEIGGGIRKRTRKHPTIINVEYVKVIGLVDDFRYYNPVCIICSWRMASQGRKGGYKCRHCGHEDKSATRISTRLPRLIRKGLYLPPPRAQRHLTKPLQRYGFEKNRWEGPVLEGWFGF